MFRIVSQKSINGNSNCGLYSFNELRFQSHSQNKLYRAGKKARACISTFWMHKQHTIPKTPIMEVVWLDKSRDSNWWWPKDAISFQQYNLEQWGTKTSHSTNHCDLLLCHIGLDLEFIFRWKSMSHLRLTFITHHTPNIIDTPPEKMIFGWI